MELEAEVQKLKELNAELQKKQVYVMSCCAISVHFAFSVQMLISAVILDFD